MSKAILLSTRILFTNAYISGDCESAVTSKLVPHAQAIWRIVAARAVSLPKLFGHFIFVLVDLPALMLAQKFQILPRILPAQGNFSLRRTSQLFAWLFVVPVGTTGIIPQAYEFFAGHILPFIYHKQELIYIIFPQFSSSFEFKNLKIILKILIFLLIQ